MNENKMLSTTLYDLAKKIIKCVKKGIDEDEIAVKQVGSIKVKFFDIEYEKGISKISESREIISKDNWDEQNEYKFIKNTIKQLDEYKESNQLISNVFNVPINQSDKWLSKFAYKVAEEAIKGIDDCRICDLIVLFVCELEHNPISWKPIVWLNGIYLNADIIEITDGCKIKKPEPVDFEYEIPYESIHHVFSSRTTRTYPSAIMKIECRADGQPTIYTKIENIITTLRLFKVGSVSSVRTEWNSTSLLELDGLVTCAASVPTEPFTYGLNPEDEESLQAFFEIIEPKLVVESTIKTDFITIALDRYNESLLRNDIPESRLASAIMCLEALYLKDNESGELANRLSQRTAIAIKYFGYKPLEVFNLVQKSYGIRSSFVHGSKSNEDEIKNIDNLIYSVLDYARISILMFLQIQDSIEKGTFINKLNNSLLDDEAKQELERILEENCRYR